MSLLRTAIFTRTTTSTSRTAVSAGRWARWSSSQVKSDSRTSPGVTPVKGEKERTHPGYTSVDTPATSAAPADMPDAAGAAPSSQRRGASTQARPPHPDVETMAKGAESEQGGADAIKPTERSQKVWGFNNRDALFNEHEGRRNPVLHGGSHEGGLREDGKGSKT